MSLKKQNLDTEKESTLVGFFSTGSEPNLPEKNSDWIDRFKWMYDRIRDLESTLREKEKDISHLRSTVSQREIDVVDKQSEIVKLNLRLKYTEKQFKEITTELTGIKTARIWKLVRTYAMLKSLCIIGPKTAFRRTFQRIQMDGFIATVMQGGTYLLGRKKPFRHYNHNSLALPSPDDYRAFLQNNTRSLQQLLYQRQESLNWHGRPLITLIIPVFNTKTEWLKSLLLSVSNQTYDRWEVILVDDNSTSFETINLLREQPGKDKRFKLIERLENAGTATACQDGLKTAAGDFVSVVDHDDILEPDALYHVAYEIMSRPDADVIYSDEVLVDENENIKNVVFRPKYSYNRLLSHPYIVHLTVFRKSLALEVGGFDTSYETSQDYDLLLRLAAVTDRFVHIPRILYRWRQHPNSMGHQKIKKTMSSSIRAISHHLKLKGEFCSSVTPGLSYNFFRVQHHVKDTFVSIIIPTRDRVDLLIRCLKSFRSITHLPQNVKYELIIADNGSKSRETHSFLEKLKQEGHQIVRCDYEFNFSKINNECAHVSRGDMLLFLNNDTEIVDAGWLTALLEHAQRPEIGAVGAKLVYPEGLIQHAGVILGMNGCAGHSHQFFPENNHWRPCGGYLDELLCIRECAAVTAACMMVRRKVFEEVGKFDENFLIGFGDTDLCIRILRAGYQNIWTPYARLIHYESASRGKRGDAIHLHPMDERRFKAKWKEILKAGDPFYNPNLSRTSNRFMPET